MKQIVNLRKITRYNNLSQHNLTIENTQLNEARNLIDLVINRNLHNEECQKIKITNAGHLQKYDYHSGLYGIISEKHNIVKNNDANINSVSLIAENSNRLNLNNNNQQREWVNFLLNPDSHTNLKFTSYWKENEKYEYIIGCNSFDIKCKYCDSKLSNGTLIKNEHFKTLHHKEYSNSRVGDILNILKNYLCFVESD